MIQYVSTHLFSHEIHRLLKDCCPDGGGVGSQAVTTSWNAQKLVLYLNRDSFSSIFTDSSYGTSVSPDPWINSVGGNFAETLRIGQ